MITTAPQAPPPEAPSTGRHRVVIVGGGFCGIYAARALRRAPVNVSIVDRRNLHVFSPMLYRPRPVPSPPLRFPSHCARWCRQRNARATLGEMTNLDPERRELLLSDGTTVYGRGACSPAGVGAG
jgi:NADH dehydrogenase